MDNTLLPKINAQLCQDLAENFRKTYDGKMPDDVLNQNVASIKGMASANNDSYSVTVTVQAYVVYSHVTIESDMGQFAKVFQGDAGGVGAGGGKASGLLYLASGVTLDALFSQTKSFEINAAIGFTNVNIFDANSRALAHVVAGGAMVAGFIGGGTGAWEG